VWAALAGPVIGLVAVGLVRMIGLVSHYRPRGGWAIVAPLGATLVLGLIGRVDGYSIYSARLSTITP